MPRITLSFLCWDEIASTGEPRHRRRAAQPAEPDRLAADVPVPPKRRSPSGKEFQVVPDMPTEVSLERRDAAHSPRRPAAHALHLLNRAASMRYAAMSRVVAPPRPRRASLGQRTGLSVLDVAAEHVLGLLELSMQEPSGGRVAPDAVRADGEDRRGTRSVRRPLRARSRRGRLSRSDAERRRASSRRSFRGARSA